MIEMKGNVFMDAAANASRLLEQCQDDVGRKIAETQNRNFVRFAAGMMAQLMGIERKEDRLRVLDMTRQMLDFEPAPMQTPSHVGTNWKDNVFEGSTDGMHFDNAKTPTFLPAERLASGQPHIITDRDGVAWRVDPGSGQASRVTFHP